MTVTGTRKDTVLMTRVFNALYGNSFDSSLPMQLPSYPPDHRMFPHPGIFNAVVQHPYMEYLQSKITRSYFSIKSTFIDVAGNIAMFFLFSVGQIP